MKIVKHIKSYIEYNWSWVRVLSSPFVGLKLKWYFGDIQHGVPYFLPRNNWFKFDYVSLGWKTKFGDIRHEWDPMFSLVLLKKQIVVWFLPNTGCSSIYWESWLNYYFNTNKNLSEEDRVIELIKDYPQIWTSFKGGNMETVNYLYEFLKPKYRYLTNENEIVEKD
ncbi:MAG: hypothetical protein FWC41_10885 [Firmicutes bacterium]|nr:hypothetical protein [Bacillota bacterium]